MLAGLNFDFANSVSFQVKVSATPPFSRRTLVLEVLQVMHAKFIRQPFSLIDVFSLW